MKTTATISEKLLVISLPEKWFGDESQDYTRNTHFPPGHAWAGQVDEQHYENHDVDRMWEALREMEGVDPKESNVYSGMSCSYTVATELPDQQVLDQVSKVLEELAERRQ